ncbi:hypothetical protein EI94DRAFT_1719723 [Lactarius quietus]|nr:hypothetical protein EI94DRAFT_1719723 [Lactarius quietus]
MRRCDETSRDGRVTPRMRRGRDGSGVGGAESGRWYGGRGRDEKMSPSTRDGKEAESRCYGECDGDNDMGGERRVQWAYRTRGGKKGRRWRGVSQTEKRKLAFTVGLWEARYDLRL